MQRSPEGSSHSSEYFPLTLLQPLLKLRGARRREPLSKTSPPPKELSTQAIKPQSYCPKTKNLGQKSFPFLGEKKIFLGLQRKKIQPPLFLFFTEKGETSSPHAPLCNAVALHATCHIQRISLRKDTTDRAFCVPLPRIYLRCKIKEKDYDYTRI